MDYQSVPGPAGLLQVVEEQGVNEPCALAVVCHPHPLYGGSLTNKVVHQLAKTFRDMGAVSVRFNFRGVGGSDGSFDQGVGELQDLFAVADWVRQEYPRDKLWLAGYSFGASIVWQSLATLQPDRTLLVAPPVGAMNFAVMESDVRIDVFAGDQDNFLDADAVNDLFGEHVHWLSGADHFFQGHHDALAERVAAVI